MWLRGKPKNRKFSRQQVLEVKLRAQHVRARRWRIARAFLTGLIGLGALLFIIWQGGKWIVDELVFSNPSFAIVELELETDGILPPAQIRQWAGVREGDNLFAVDLARIRRDLEMVSVVQRASAHRVFPQKLVIRITEREPLARIPVFQPRAPAGLEPAHFFLDASGYVIVPPPSAPGAARLMAVFENLPILTGYPPGEVRPGRSMNTPPVLSALRFLQEFGRSPMSSLVEVRQIHLASSQTLLVTTGAGSEIIFRTADFPRQLRRWQVVEDYARTSGRALATLDLSVSNYVPARWQTRAQPTSLPFQPPQPRLSRRPHV